MLRSIEFNRRFVGLGRICLLPIESRCWFGIFLQIHFPVLNLTCRIRVLSLTRKHRWIRRKIKECIFLWGILSQSLSGHGFHLFFRSESKLEPHITYSKFSSLKKEREEGAFLNRVQLISPDTLRLSLDGLSISSTLKQELENVYQDIRKRHKDELFLADGVGIYKNNLPLLRIDIPSSLQEKRTGVLPGKEYLILTRYEL